MDISLSTRNFATAAIATCAAAGLLFNDNASASAGESLTFRGVLKPRDAATIDVKPTGGIATSPR